MAKNEPPGVTPPDALARMDQMIALSLVGQGAMADRLGVNVTDLTCLGFILEAAEDPITAGRLAERAGLTTGAVTGVVNRLEKAGYVRRLSDSDDRRRIRIVPEGDAAARVTAAYEPVYRRLIALFEDYGPGELGVISDWFTRAAEIMRLSLAEIREPEAP